MKNIETMRINSKLEFLAHITLQLILFLLLIVSNPPDVLYEQYIITKNFFKIHFKKVFNI